MDISENNYIKILKAIPLPAFLLKIVNQTFEIVEVNDPFLKTCRSERKSKPNTPEDLLKKINFQDAFFPAINHSLLKVAETGNPHKIENIRFDITFSEEKGDVLKKYWNLQLAPLKNRDGKVENILLIAEDVTEHNFKIQNQQDFNNKLVKNNTDALYSLDTEGNFTNVNDGMVQLAGLPREEMLKMNFLPFCAPEDKGNVLEQFQKVIQGATVHLEANFISAKGENLVLSVSLMPMMVEEKIVGAYGIAKDLTDFKRTEKVMIEKKRLLEVSSTFIKSLFENELEEKALKKAFGVVGEAVSADRMYYFQIHQNFGEDFASQKVEWTSSTVKPHIDDPQMQFIPTSDLHEIIVVLEKNIPFTATFDELEEGKLKNIFEYQQIKSMLLLPIFLKNKLYGFIGFDDCQTSRQWNQDEKDFLKSLSRNFTTAIEKRTAETQLKEREEELRQSEQKFKVLVQEGSDMIAIINFMGYYKFISDTTTSILNIKPEELLGKNVFDFIHPEDKEYVQEQFYEIKKCKRIKLDPFRFKDKDGEWRWIETTATDLTDDPAVGGIVTNSRDISRLMRQASEIESINERYRLAAAATQDIVYDWDLQTDEVQRFYRSLNEVFGFPPEEVRERDFWPSHIHPQDKQELKRILEETLDDKEKAFMNTSYRFRRADGTYADVIDRAFIIRNEEGKAIRLVGASSDISELKTKEKALETVNRRFELAMKATNEMIWDWHLETNEIIRSKAFERIFKFSYEDHSIDYWISRIPDKEQERVRNSLNAALDNKEKKLWKEEYCLTNGVGNETFVIDRATIIRNKEGKAVRVVGAVLDITATKKMLKEIKKQNEILKEIAWEQSHTVRAPLVRLKGLLELLEDKAFTEIGKDEVLRYIHSSADELDEIIRKIVKKSERIGTVKKK